MGKFNILPPPPILCSYMMRFEFLGGAVGHLCPAFPKAILTMTKGEKARFIVQSQCMSLYPC